MEGADAMAAHTCTEGARLENMERILEEVRADIKEIKKHLYIGNGNPSLKSQVESNTAFRLRFEKVLDGLTGKVIALLIFLLGGIAALIKVIR